MHAVRQGSGRPLLLIHGLGANARTWEPVMPALAQQREVIAVDLPGFGQTAPLAGEVSIATLADAVTGFIEDEGLGEVDLVGASMGARIVLELTRRGVGGTTVALSPGGFWDRRQLLYFAVSLRASVKLVRLLDPVLPALTRNPVGRTMLLSQFSVRPWALPSRLALQELRSIVASRSFEAALDSLVHGPRQQGLPAAEARQRVVIGWARHDRVCLPSQAQRATDLFPSAELYWFERCGHYQHWDRPYETVRVILDSTADESRATR